MDMRKYYEQLLTVISQKADWISLSSWIHSLYIKSFAFWLVFTPIVVPLLMEIKDENIRLIGLEFGVNIFLLFQILIFYLCAIAYSLAFWIYLVYCPKIIRELKNEKAISGWRYNLPLLLHYINLEFNNSESELQSSEKLKSIRNDLDAIQGNKKQINKGQEFTPYYYEVLIAMSQFRKNQRYAIVFCWLFGSIAMFCVFIINIINVIMAML
jgi:hypothetical protein